MIPFVRFPLKSASEKYFQYKLVHSVIICTSFYSENESTRFETSGNWVEAISESGKCVVIE